MDSLRISLTFPTTSREPYLNTMGCCTAKVTTMKYFQSRLQEHICPNPFFTRRMKMLCRPDGFTLYRKLAVDFFSSADFLYPNMKVRLRLIRAGPNFCMISDNPNVSLGIVDCWLYTCHIALKNDYHRKWMDKLAYTPVEYNYLETLAKTFISPARKNQFFQESISNNNPVRQIAIAMNTNSAFTGSYTENPFWFQHFELRQIKILREVQPIVGFDATDICRLYATKMKAMNFQDDIYSIPIDNFKNHYKIAFDLTSMQDATENCHFPQLLGEILRVELSFSFPLEHVIELSVLGNECLRLQLTNLVLSEKKSKMDNASLQRTQVSVPCFVSFWLCSNSWQWHFC